MSAATLYRWKRQALIDVGRKPGVKSFEPDELDRARRQIKDLEASSSSSRRPARCSTAKRWCAQKARPGRQRAEPPGLHRENRLSSGRHEPLHLALSTTRRPATPRIETSVGYS